MRQRAKANNSLSVRRLQIVSVQDSEAVLGPGDRIWALRRFSSSAEKEAYWGSFTALKRETGAAVYGEMERQRSGVNWRTQVTHPGVVLPQHPAVFGSLVMRHGNHFRRQRQDRLARQDQAIKLNPPSRNRPGNQRCLLRYAASGRFRIVAHKLSPRTEDMQEGNGVCPSCR